MRTCVHVCAPVCSPAPTGDAAAASTLAILFLILVDRFGAEMSHLSGRVQALMSRFCASMATLDVHAPLLLAEVSASDREAVLPLVIWRQV